jgi:hypothetical protein
VNSVWNGYTAEWICVTPRSRGTWSFKITMLQSGFRRKGHDMGHWSFEVSYTAHFKMFVAWLYETYTLSFTHYWQN